MNKNKRFNILINKNFTSSSASTPFLRLRIWQKRSGPPLARRIKPKPRSFDHRLIDPIWRFWSLSNPDCLDENKLSVVEFAKPLLKLKDFSVDVESSLVEYNFEDRVPPNSNADDDDDWFLEEPPKPNLDDVELLFDEPPGNRLVPVFIILTSYQ